jgi:hypothetical protein
MLTPGSGIPSLSVTVPVMFFSCPDTCLRKTSTNNKDRTLSFCFINFEFLLVFETIEKGGREIGGMANSKNQ